MLDIEQVREWTQCTRPECQLQEEKIHEYIDFNFSKIKNIDQTIYVHLKVLVHGLVCKPEYNGKCCPSTSPALPAL